MKVYSHSKLWLYENCPKAYKVKYIDKEWPDLPPSIHAFLGSSVHDSLEWLYGEEKEQRPVELDELVKHFAENWHKKYTLDIRVPVGEKVEEFFNKGVKFLVDYYQANKPFSDNTIEIEKKIFFPLDEGHWIVGYVDRIVKSGDGKFEVVDYKTNSRIKEQKEVDADRQLAFYHLGMQEIFGKDIDVDLTWHFLAHNRKVHSKRTQEQLDKLRDETLELISKIENTTEWSACGKMFCDWCSYKKLQGLDREENT
ncbi:MAG: PD-(D/E)XK nuclease family protein, partial [Nanoarchaeota archaeon]